MIQINVEKRIDRVKSGHIDNTVELKHVILFDII